MKGNGSIVYVEDLVSGYGKKDILHDVTIHIKGGEITTLIGRNGVGKTTLLQTIVGFLRPKKGNIYYRGEDISGVKTHVLAGMGISYVPQGKAIFPHMTVEEHIHIGAWTLTEENEAKSMMQRVFALFPRLAERKSQKAGTLSGGERQMLSIARALMLQPKLLLLDEPSFGLSPKLVNIVFDNIQEIKQDGVTIFMVEQNAKKALENSDVGYVMDMGRITFTDQSHQLLQNEEVRLSYLGGKQRVAG